MKWPLEIPRFTGIIIMPFVLHFTPWSYSARAAAAFAIVVTGSLITRTLYKRAGLN
jgi:hypothetical protein